MDKVLDKISEYEIVNNLVPGSIYLFFLIHFCDVQFDEEDVLQMIVISFFFGVLIGRTGSLIFEPLMRKFKLIKFVEYAAFINAEKKDDKIQILLKGANMYRSFMSMMFYIIITKLFYIWIIKCPNIKDMVFWIALIATIIIFLVAYIKQSNTLIKRVEEANREIKK